MHYSCAEHCDQRSAAYKSRPCSFRFVHVLSCVPVLGFCAISKYGSPSVQLTSSKANSAFHPFGVDKLSSEQLYRMCAGRTIW